MAASRSTFQPAPKQTAIPALARQGLPRAGGCERDPLPVGVFLATGGFTMPTASASRPTSSTSGRPAAWCLMVVPAQAYDWDIQKQVEVAKLGKDFVGYFAWHYPPPFLFVASLLAQLPYTRRLYRLGCGQLPALILP